MSSKCHRCDYTKGIPDCGGSSHYECLYCAVCNRYTSVRIVGPHTDNDSYGGLDLPQSIRRLIVSPNTLLLCLVCGNINGARINLTEAFDEAKA